MTTVEFALTGSYQVIGTKLLTWVAIQNIGNSDITINLKATTPPVDADKGIILKPMQIVTNIQIGDEDVYAKSRSGAGTLVITK